MLERLYIENVAVIERAEIEFYEGFNILTGETGAGKSIIIDSLGMLLGQRASKDLVRTGCSCAYVAGRFALSGAAVHAKLDELGRDSSVVVQRYKGLGEMDPEQLWETTMEPATRTLLQVNIDDAVEAERVVSELMGEQVEPRKEFIQKHARDVRFLDI